MSILLTTAIIILARRRNQTVGFYPKSTLGRTREIGDTIPIQENWVASTIFAEKHGILVEFW
jgi:hypothetical protein